MLSIAWWKFKRGGDSTRAAGYTFRSKSTKRKHIFNLSHQLIRWSDNSKLHVQIEPRNKIPIFPRRTPPKESKKSADVHLSRRRSSDLRTECAAQIAFYRESCWIGFTLSSSSLASSAFPWALESVCFFACGSRGPWCEHCRGARRLHGSGVTFTVGPKQTHTP